LAYNLIYKKSVIRDLESLPKKEIQRIRNQIIEVLLKNPYSFPALKGEFAGLRKFRVGKYRVIYTIVDNDVIIARIGHRKDVYR
jgi:mRNA interferase RelE/StbE